MARSQKSKRFDPIINDDFLTSDQYTPGIGDGPSARKVARLVLFWPHIEEAAIDFLRVLLSGGMFFPARQIFRAISAQNTRIKVMRFLLERSIRNSDRGTEFDDIVSEFEALNGVRNDYAHGLWYRHKKNNRIFLSGPATDDPPFRTRREVKADELDENYRRMRALWFSIKEICARDRAAQRQLHASRRIPPEQ